MATPEIGKLVRDGIPDLIRSQGGEPIVRPAAVHELPDLLRAKLAEEVVEYLESGDVAELVDILGVVLALAGQVGLSRPTWRRPGWPRPTSAAGSTSTWSGTATAAEPFTDAVVPPATKADQGDWMSPMMLPSGLSQTRSACPHPHP